MNNDKVIARMRDRVQRVRKVAAMAHDPKMIAMLEKIAQDGEADIRKLEAEEASRTD